MNIFEKKLKTAKGRYSEMLTRKLAIQVIKVSEIASCNKPLPKWVKDGLIDSFELCEEKRAFLMKNKIRKKPLDFLLKNEIIEKSDFKSVFLIKNMPKEWISYPDFLKRESIKRDEIISRVFKDGMRIFDK